MKNLTVEKNLLTFRNESNETQLFCNRNWRVLKHKGRSFQSAELFWIVTCLETRRSRTEADVLSFHWGGSSLKFTFTRYIRNKPNRTKLKRGIRCHQLRILTTYGKQDPNSARIIWFCPAEGKWIRFWKAHFPFSAVQSGIGWVIAASDLFRRGWKDRAMRLKFGQFWR